MAKIIVTYKNNEADALENTFEIDNVSKCVETYDTDGQKLNVTCDVPNDTSIFEGKKGLTVVLIELLIDDVHARNISDYKIIEDINSYFYSSNIMVPRTTIVFA